MSNIIGALDGKKTYIVAGLTILYAIVGLLIGQLQVSQAIELILAGLGGIGIRSAISKLQ